MKTQLAKIGVEVIDRPIFLRRLVTDMMYYPGVTTLPFIQAARTYVKGYENLHGHKIRFETTWLDK